MSTNLSNTNTNERFERLYKAHWQMVYRTAHGVTNSHQDAEDVTQTVFMNAVSHPEEVEGSRNVKGLLYRSARNTALNLARTRTRQRLVDDPEILDTLAAPGRTEHESTQYDALQRAKAQLKPEHAELLALRHEQELSYSEIGEMVGCSTANAATKLFRIHARLTKLVIAELAGPKSLKLRGKGFGVELSAEGETR